MHPNYKRAVKALFLCKKGDNMINITSTKYLDLKNGKFNIDKAGVVGDSNSRYLKIKIENLSDDVRVDLICKVSENVYVSHAEKIKGHYLVKFPNEVFRNEGSISFQIKVSDGESTVFSDIMTANVSKSLVLEGITESNSEESINIDKLIELSKLDLDSLQKQGGSLDKNLLNEKINEKVGDLSKFKDILDKDNISVLDVLYFYVNSLTSQISRTDELIERSEIDLLPILLNDIQRDLNDLKAKVSFLESKN